MEAGTTQASTTENYKLNTENYVTTYKKEIETNTINCSLTKANTWLFDYTNTYSYDTNTTSDTQESVEENTDTFDYKNVENVDEADRESSNLAKNFLQEQINYVKNEIANRGAQNQVNTVINVSSNTAQSTNSVQEVTGKIYTIQHVNSTRIVGLNKKTITTTTLNKYTQGTPETKLKTDADSEDPNFITLLNKYSSARSGLYELSSWLFSSLEKDENTADMIDLTKYLFNVQTNSNKYGNISEEDILDWLKKSSFSSVSASSALVEWICCNENENLYNFLHYDGSYNATFVSTHVTADKKEYIVMPDDGNDLAHNRNYGFGVKTYTKDRDTGKENYNNVENFAEHGIDITKPEYNNEGAKISVEIVDAITKKIINEDKARIKNEASSYGVTLDDAQIAVLIDIKYQWGNIGNFFEVYKNAGQDRTNTAIRQFQAYDSDGNLGGKPLDGVEYVNRENRRWKLFSEGIFETESGRIITPSAGMSESAEGIVESAKALVELTQYGGPEQTSYDASRVANNSGFRINEYVCASFVSEVLYNATGFSNWHAGVDGLGVNLYNDPNYELVYYKNTNNSVSDANGVREFSSDVNVSENIEDIIQPGDIVATYSSEYKFKHVVVYIGENQYAHHGGGSGVYNYPHISTNFFSSYDNSNVKYIFRYKGQ